MPQNRSTAVMQRRVDPPEALDDFPTPPWATRALLEWVIRPRLWARSESLRTMNAWEPACGRGHMAAALAERFFAVHASDVADYGADEVRAPHYRGQERVSDFLGLDAVPPHIERMGVDWIITNPPFRLGAEFVHRALALRPRRGVAMLTRLAFLEGVGRYRDLFRAHPPSVIAQFTERVPMLKGRLVRRGSTATAYCWLVWMQGLPERGPVFQWISPCRRELERDEDYGEAGE